MLIISRVCAEFRDKLGQIILEVAPNKRNCIMDVPEAIREDPLFELMLADGSLEAVHSVAQQRRLENDPLAGITAEGKKLIQESDPIPESPAEGKEVSTDLESVADPTTGGKKPRKSASKSSSSAKEISADIPDLVMVSTPAAEAEEALPEIDLDHLEAELSPLTIEPEHKGRPTRKSAKQS